MAQGRGDPEGDDMTFMCDPKKNTQCRSPLCFEHGGPCGTTDDVRAALRDLTGRPVEIIEEGEQNGKTDRQ